MTSMLDRISVEAFLFPPDAPGYWLDADTLGTGVLSDDGDQWVPITDEVRDISIQRGSAPGKVSTTPEVGTVTITFVDAPLRGLKPSTGIRINGDGKRLFTGQVLDIRDVETPKGPNPHRISTVTAVDRVAQIANTMRYGAYSTPSEDTPWHIFETSAERFARYLNPTGWEWEGPRTLVTTWDYIPYFGLGVSNPAEGSIGRAGATSELPARIIYYLFDDPPASGFRTEHMFTDLPPSTPIVITAWVRSVGTAPVAAVNGQPLPADGSWALITTTDTSSAAGILTVRFAVNRSDRTNDSVIEIAGVTLTTGTCPAYEVQNIVYESTLVNHLDLTAATTKGAWWVDAHNVIQTRTCTHLAAGPKPRFTDGTIPPDGIPGTDSYVDLEFSFDTANSVNSLTFANHGRTWDDETSAYVADDTNIPAGTHPTSIATYGERAETIHTAFPITTPSLDGMLTTLPDRVGAAYLEESSLPTRAPRYMRVHHAPGSSMPDLDIRDTFDLIRHAHTYICTITGIRHSITRETWHTDYQIIPRKEA